MVEGAADMTSFIVPPILVYALACGLHWVLRGFEVRRPDTVTLTCGHTLTVNADQLKYGQFYIGRKIACGELHHPPSSEPPRCFVMVGQTALPVRNAPE
jgi:hypothetical protein